MLYAGARCSHVVTGIVSGVCFFPVNSGVMLSKDSTEMKAYLVLNIPFSALSTRYNLLVIEVLVFS